MHRRQFIKLAASAGLALPTSTALAANPDVKRRFVGMQISPFTIFDEGVERCLDLLRDAAGINTLVCFSHTYLLGSKPKNVLADHGFNLQPRNFFKDNQRFCWVRTHDKYYKNTVVRHQPVTRNTEYHDRDIFSELAEPARKRGMKVYARMLEAGGRRAHRIPNYDKVLTVDIDGKPGRGPCWNHPHYREWLYATVRDLVENNSIDGFQWGAERTGPLSYVLFRGLIPTCFCQYCKDRNKQHGINADRAKQGFRDLYQLVKGLEQNKPKPADGVFTMVLRIFQRFPEVLSWDYQWFQADEEIGSEIHRIVKSIQPNIESGRHIDHQRSSWDVFYRAAMPYDQIAQNADFIKPILYHETLGPRLRWWVIAEMQKRVLNELSLKQSLELYYALFHQDRKERPPLDRLDKAGLGPEYVFRETKRCKDAVRGSAKVYAGIGIDVPWYVPNGMERRPSNPETMQRAVKRAFDAGADGVLASREYIEMSLQSLKAFGSAIRAL